METNYLSKALKEQRILSRSLVSKINSPNGTALRIAIHNENAENVKLLVDAGANVNSINSKGETALECALNSFGYSRSLYQIIKVLINAGANVDAVDKNGRTALHFAAIHGNVDGIQFLVSKGANIEAKDSQDVSPLHLAASYYNDDISVIEALLKAGANPNATDTQGNTPLHFVILNWKANKSISKILNIFIDHGADIKSMENHGQELMDLVLDYNYNFEAIKVLLDNGADINGEISRTLNRKQSILHIVCVRADLDGVKYLLKNGANINALDQDGLSPLHFTMERALKAFQTADFPYCKMLIDVLSYLLKRDPDVNTVSKNGSNIIDFIYDGYGLTEDLYRPIIEHLAKLDATNRPLLPKLLQSVREFKCTRLLFEECAHELERCKRDQLGSSFITFFNLVVDDKAKLCVYAANVELVEFYNETNVAKKYPYYGSLIKERFTKAIRHQKLIDQSSLVLSSCLPCYFNPRDIVIRKILSYCKTKDLKKFCKKKSE